jgi:hypothetical protein
MYWSIKMRHFDRAGFPISMIKIHGEDLREAASKVLDIYRKSIILTYQHNEGPEIDFDSSRLKPIYVPTNIHSLGAQKVLSRS